MRVALVDFYVELEEGWSVFLCQSIFFKLINKTVQYIPKTWWVSQEHWSNKWSNQR